jgi:hypothetical protein
MAVPPGVVPGLLDPRQRSGWQLAQEVWQESGVAWEFTDTELAGSQFPGSDFASTEPVEPEPVEPEPAKPEPAKPESARPEPADTESAGTWFDGPGPADPRLAARRSVGDSPTVVEFTRPHFADSGFVPMQSGLSSPASPAQPTFTPAENPRLAPRDRLRQAPVGEADGQGPPRSAPAHPNRPRPQPMAGDEEQYDRIRFGSDQALPARRPATGWNGHPEAGYAEAGYAEAGYAEAGYAESGYAEAGYAEAGYAESGYPEAGYPESGFPEQAWPAGSGQVPLGAPVMAGTRASAQPGTAGFSGAGVPPRAGSAGGAPPLGEPDQLFRAWQGSVREAAAPRRAWSASRPGASPRRRRALQVATIGVPAAVIITVGAGALLMLTGKANEMLAPRSDTGAVSPAAPAAKASIGPSAKGVPPAFAGATLPGYPGQHGTVTVASMQLVGGVALAAGTADGHPAIWRRAASGTWTLESAATLGAVAGRAGLASVAYGQAGWIAVGMSSNGGTTQPLVVSSADGVTWQPAGTLEALAGRGTEFLGIAAGHGGYVAVGRQLAGGRIFAVLWYSADLRSWTLGSNGGLDGRLSASTVNAVAATDGGFAAVGSHGAGQAIWISADGKHWILTSVNLPSGAHSATLTAVAASGSRVVAAGYAHTPAGDIPVVVASVDGGARWRQTVLPTAGRLGVITALTATPSGFTAAGRAGKGGSAHTVTWTSADGLTWSRPAQTADSEITALTAAGTGVIGTAERGATPAVVAFPAP